MGDYSPPEWNHEKLLTLFTGLLVVIGAIYSVATIFQWQSMREQNRAMWKQLEVINLEVEETKLNRSADLILRFRERLDKPPHLGLRYTVESGKPILKQHRGKFSDEDLESYLGIFDNLNDLYEKGMINKDLFYNEYSYDVEKLSGNVEVQSYLASIRKEDADFYSGVDALAKKMKAYPNPAPKH